MTADIICLQECHSTPAHEELWKKQWQGEVYFSHGESNARGVCILVKKHLNASIKIRYRDDLDPTTPTAAKGHIIIIDVEVKQIAFTLMNIYAPNVDEPQFFQKAFTEIMKSDCSEKMIVGDFNCVLNIEQDRKGSLYNHAKSALLLNDYLESFELTDIWRHRNNEAQEFTYMKIKPRIHFARLDFFLVSTSILNRVEDVSHLPGFATDHSIVTLTINTTVLKRGRGFWKLNLKHLQDDTYISGAKIVMRKATKKYEKANKATKWELIKCEAIGFSTVYSIEKAKKRNEHIRNLNRTLKYLTNLLEDKYEEKVYNEYKKVQAEMDSYMQAKTQTLIFVSKANYYQEGEQNSKYYMSLAKQRALSETMLKVSDEKGKMVQDPQQILKLQGEYYEKLYKANPEVQFRLQNKTAVKLTNEARSALEQLLTVAELKDAVFDFTPDHTLGCDGLPALWYQVMWEEIEQYLYEAYLYAYEAGELHISARRGYLSLIPKKDRDLLVLKNWRPLMMLSLDYKILSKALDARMKKCLPSLIADYQTGFMEKRSILTNIIRLMDMMEVSARKRIQMLVMSTDFEKCFDMISHTAISGSMRYFGFGEKFIKWVMLLFTNFKICTQNNGYISSWIKPSQGVHQGCPISPHCYNLNGQVFAHIFENNEKIDGATIHGIYLLLSQFADDTNLFLKPSKTVLEQVTQCFAVAESNLGLKVNYGKTAIYRIGSLGGTDAKMYTKSSYVWKDPPIETLGIIVDNDMAIMIQKNILPLVEKAKNRLAAWNNRTITLLGRVTIVNTLIESLFVYRFSVLSWIDERILDDMQRVIKDFIWNKKKAKVAHNILRLPVKQGGLRIVDLKVKHQALIIQWVQKAIKDSYMSAALENNIATPLQHKIWKCNIKVDNAVQVIGEDKTFWSGLFVQWCRYNYHEVKTSNAVKEQYIWFNSHIKIGQKMCYNASMYTSNIKKIKDLMVENDFCSFATIRERQIDINWLDYTGIIAAIPTKWKKLLKENEEDTEIYSTKFDKILECQKVASVIYHDILNDSKALIPVCNRWRPVLEGEAITINEFTNAFVNCRKVTISTKLRDFQYRLLHKKIPTNKELCKWKMKNSDMCDFCESSDSIQHTLYYCSHMQKIWEELPAVISQLTGAPGSEITINLKNVILNLIHAKPGNIANLFCLVLKQLIYHFKCDSTNSNRTKIMMSNLTAEIKLIRQIEYYNAIKVKKVTQHMKKWSKVKQRTTQSDNVNNIISQFVNNM